MDNVDLGTKVFAGIFVFLIAVAVVFIIIDQIKSDIAHDRLIRYNFEKLQERLVKPFFISEYLSRIEKEHLKILEEREKKPKYIITLWLGLDGLRMNEDGTYEWVTKKKKEIPAIKETFKEYEELSCSHGSRYIPTIPPPIYHPVTTTKYLASYPQYYPSYCISPFYTWYTPYQQSFLPYSTYYQINQCTSQQLQQINQSMQMQTAQIDSNMRLLEMLNSQQTCKLIDQQQNMY